MTLTRRDAIRLLTGAAALGAVAPFAQAEENQCCQTLEVQVMVFTISGKLVKTIDQFISMEGFRSAPIDWDGRDDFGDKIGRGVYIYRVKVKTNDGSSAEKYEKLVILN